MCILSENMERWRKDLTLLRFVWEKKKRAYWLIVLFLPLSVITGVLEVYLPKAVLAELEQKASISHFILTLGVISVVMLTGLYIKDMIMVRLQNANALLHRELQMDYIKKLLYTEYKYLENKEYLTLRDRAKSIIYSVYSHPGTTEDYIGMFLIKIAKTASQVLIIAVYLIWLFRLSPGLLLFVVSIVFIIGLMSVSSGKKKQEYEEKAGLAWKKAQYINERIGDFTYAKDIRLYSMQGWLSGVMEKYMGLRLHYKKCSLFSEGIWSALRFLAVGIEELVVYGYLINEVLQGRLVASDFVLYAGMVGVLAQNMIDVAANFTSLYSISLGFKRVKAFLEFGENINIEELPLHTEKVTLELEHVSYRFAGCDEEILKDIHFKVATGDKIAVVGLNGAGKTTLMKLICGLLEPTEGRILLNGKDMKDMSSEERYSWFSCAFQDVSFLPVSILENISLSTKKDTDRKRVKDCLKKAGILEKVEKLSEGLDSLMEKDINENAVDFSGGERQKLVLAKALYRDTSILILDEPTAALDPLAENEMYQKYAGFSKDKISFFVSHRLSSTSFCDQILLINGGRIQEIGTHEELLEKNGLYAEMFRLQGHYYQ